VRFIVSRFVPVHRMVKFIPKRRDDFAFVSVHYSLRLCFRTLGFTQSTDENTGKCLIRETKKRIIAKLLWYV